MNVAGFEILSARRPLRVAPVLLVFVGIVARGHASAAAQSEKLSGSMLRPFRGEVEDVQVSPDGAWTVYEGPSENGEFRLFSVPTKGGAPNELGVPYLGYSRRTAITPDSRSILYSDATSGGVLLRVPIDGSRGPVQLAPYGPDFDFTPDGARVVYSTGVALFSLVLAGAAAPVRLTQPLVAGGKIARFRVGRGGRLAPDRVVYLADAEVDGRIEVYSVPADGSAPPVKLSEPGSSNPWFVEIAAGGERVVYLTEFLMGAPITGGSEPILLSDVPGIQNRLQIELSPDGRWVVFLAEPETPGVFELLSIPIDGSRPAVRLNPDLPSGADVGSLRIAPDSRRVVYLADQEVDDRLQLYSVPIEGGSAPVELSPLQPNESVFGFELSRDRLVYLSMERVDETWVNPELYSVPIAGGADPILLSDAVRLGFRVSPDGARVVFFEQESVGTSLGLFSVPIGGGVDPVLLDGAGIDTMAITANGDTVLYRADRDIENVRELFSVPIAGGRSGVQLNHPMVALAVADVVDIMIGPDGERAAFVVFAETCDCDDSGAFELHDATIQPVSSPLRIADEVGTVRFSADGAWIVFMERLDDGEEFERLFSAPADGSHAPIELAPDAGSFVLTLDGSAVVFTRADPLAGVYRRALDGSSPASPLALGNATGVALSPDGSRVVYVGESASAFELFSVAVDGSGAPVQLNDLAAPRGTPRYPFAITPDGARVYYWTDQETNDVRELFSVPIGGGAPPTKLSGTLVPGGDVGITASGATGFGRVEVSADGARLVYQGDALVDGVIELFSAPIDGSAAPARLNAPLSAGRTIVQFAIAGSSRVVYRADQAADEVYELFSVPIDASAPPLRLNAPLVAGGDVAALSGVFQPAFAISPDGERVAYVADQATDQVVELFSVPVDGSAAPRRLGGPFAAGGDVREGFLITPDGKNVVYRADHDTDEVVELYVASLDGGKGRKLNPPLVAGGDVGGNPGVPRAPKQWLAITADGRWVLYVADQDTDTVEELYRVPLGDPRLASKARPPGPRARD